MKSITELAKSVGYPMLVFMGTPYVSPELRRLVEAAIEQEREAVIGLLKGIDKTEIESADGWWETSSGAEFGAGVLDAIRARSNT